MNFSFYQAHLMLLLALSVFAINYVQSPAFQSYIPTTNFYGIENFTYLYSTYPNWFIESDPQANIELRTKGQYSIVVDLIPEAPEFTCTNVTLPHSGLYSIFYDYLIDNNIDKSVMIVKVDNVQLAKVLVSNKTPLKFNVNANLTAGMHMACFGGQHPIPRPNIQMGVLFDNVTVTETTIVNVSVGVVGKYYFSNQTVILQTNFSWIPQWSLAFFQTHSTLQVDGKPLPNGNYTLFVNSTGFLSIIAKYSRKTHGPMLPIFTMPNSKESINYGQVLSFKFNSPQIEVYIEQIFTVNLTANTFLRKAYCSLNLHLQQKWLEIFPSLITLFINETAVVDYSIFFDKLNNAALQFPLAMELPNLISVEIVIANNTLINENQQFVSFRMTPIKLFIEPSQLVQVLQKLETISKASLTKVATSKQILGGVGLNLFLSSFLSFYSLTFLFHFIFFHSALIQYSSVLNNIMQANTKESAFLSGIVNQISLFKQLEKRDKIRDEKLPRQLNGNFTSLVDFGYSSRFWTNSEESILNLLFMVMKLMLIRFLCMVPLNFICYYAKKARKMQKQMLVFEVVAASPEIVLPFSAHFSYKSNLQAVDFFDHLNVGVFLLMTFFCLIASFLLWILQHPSPCSKKQKQRKKNEISQCLSQANKSENKKQTRKIKIRLVFFRIKKQKISDSVINSTNLKLQNRSTAPEQSKVNRSQIANEQKIVFIKFIENFMYFFIPIIAGQFQAIGYTLSVNAFVLLRLILLIKWRACYTRWEFIKFLINRVIWILYSGVYTVYFAIDVSGLDKREPVVFKILAVCGSTEIILFVSGILVEILIVIIEASLAIRSTIVSIKDRCSENEKDEKTNRRITPAHLCRSNRLLKKTSSRIQLHYNYY